MYPRDTSEAFEQTDSGELFRVAQEACIWLFDELRWMT